MKSKLLKINNDEWEISFSSTIKCDENYGNVIQYAVKMSDLINIVY